MNQSASLGAEALAGCLNHGWIYRDRVDAAGAGQTLLQYYTQRYRHSSEMEWRDRIELGQVRIDDQPATPDALLQRGQQLAYHRAPWVEPSVPLDFTVLHEDDDFLVVTKPSGLPVLPGGGFLEHTLLWQLQVRYPHPAPVPIHRLGRGTSGLMLLARSPLAKAHLSQQMRDQKIHKVYRALVGPNVSGDRLTLRYPIGKLPHPVLGYIYGATPTGSEAHSECVVLRRDQASTLVEVTIFTGRPHQIRIHMAAAGYPLLGDPLYAVGGALHLQSAIAPDKLPVPGDCGYLLHAHRLTFTHPRTQVSMAFVADPPPSLEA